MEFKDLDYKEFEFLIGLLLTREGFRIIKTPTDHQPFGPDFETVAPDGVPVFLEIKHFRRSERLPIAVFDQFSAELQRLRKQYANARKGGLEAWVFP